ncbi:amidohydrolase family protein [Sphingomonas sp. LaA6.9]|uniref:N-acyl-D-amino-acid deacylase family protein n=1 Tax=Sphingomonas sp. LaA6.9 TaxID=2919914 RepID=UPI001F4FC73F|nr:D-aminoacylase [Sphingomonas sp. LaA6.9]MCJ8158958.1 D-aminoacylase [Sphingomonas sp. LaA6.9]
MAFRIRRMSASLLLAALIGASAPPAAEYDLLIRGGTLYDGSGAPGVVGDIAVKGDRIVHLGGKAPGTAKETIDAQGLAVAPGFINMLSWANDSLIEDGRAQSDIRQGVTLEVMGEGTSSGPLNPQMKKLVVERQGDIKYPITWTTLGEYLDFLTKKGVSTNVASFVGAATVRENVLGEDDVDPTPAQLAEMRRIVRTAMQEGAMGVGSSLIYAPASYAETPELIALVSEAAQCGGMYISHMRSEGDRLIEAIDELIEISRASGAPAEIYHLKQAGQDNWGKLDAAIARIEDARKQGLRITADMYPYAIAGTGLDAAMPTWVQAGGLETWIERLRDPKIRARVIAEMKAPGEGWENLYRAAGGAENLIVVGFKNPALKPLTGKTLAEVAAMRGKSPEDTAIDLVIEDGSRVGTLYRLMSEDNVRRQIGLPWMSFGSDEEAAATEGVFLKYNNHPRAYGTFARVLGHYVRDQKAATLPDAIRRLSALPAENLGLKQRGRLARDYLADIVVFDPATIADRATVAKPAQYATGMRHVIVNGVPVLRDGEHTGAKPGRVVRGAGWTGWPDGGRCK